MLLLLRILLFLTEALICNFFYFFFYCFLTELLEEESDSRGIILTLTSVDLGKDPEFEIHHSAILETHFGTPCLKIIINGIYDLLFIIYCCS